jgi:transposase
MVELATEQSWRAWCDRELNGIEPLAWLTDVLERMVSDRTRAHELERLLPWAWEAERLAAAFQA